MLARAYAGGMMLRLKRCLLAVAAVLVATFGSAPAMANGEPLPVPRITIYPGDEISAEHLTERLFRAGVSSQMGFIARRDVLVGKVARRTLLPGQPIPINSVREPHTVTQGKSALIVYQADGLTITGLGVALQSAGVGDVVSLRNADSGTVIRGIVQADGSVRVGLP
jgi:flagella basal body P-ring formation protein FlgA